MARAAWPGSRTRRHCCIGGDRRVAIAFAELTIAI
jgi:hypothetical protein